MRALITGINGFVGQYLKEYLECKSVEVYGTSRGTSIRDKTFKIDLNYEHEIIKLLQQVKPTHIFHLAGMSNVRESWDNKKGVIQDNLICTINLLEAVKKVDPSIRVLTVGSSEEYGLVKFFSNNITEDNMLTPMSPYGISKASISMLIKQYKKAYELDIIHVRPFNHIGPRQRIGFVTTDFANQIAQINKQPEKSNIMKIGNLDAIRDFTDVRDIVKAYFLLAYKGKSGEIYNICSGKGIKVKKILDILLTYSNRHIELIIDSSKMRPSDVPRLVGDNSKLVNTTQWSKEYSLENTMQEIYNYWLQKQ